MQWIRLVWHHRGVSETGVRLGWGVWLGMLLVGLQAARAAPLQSGTSLAASPPANAKRLPPSHAAAGSELSALLAKQTAAIQTNDPAGIEESSRVLNAYALREFAKLRTLEGNEREAATLYRESLSLQDAPAVRLELTSVLLRLGAGAEAEANSLSVVQAEPDSAMAWTMRGSALRAVHQDVPAADAFRRALQLQPNANVAYALGSCLLAAHKKAEAEQLFDGILRASGKDPVWYVAVGDAYRESGYLQDAVRLFKQALALDPGALHAEFFLGYTYLQLNQWGPTAQSFQHLREAARQSPHEYTSNFYLGALESTDGSDLPSSDRHLQAAAAADPSQPEAWIYLGLNASREHNSERAKTYLEKAITLTGQDEARNGYQVRRACLALGRILLSEGDRARGEELLARYKLDEQAAVAASGAAADGGMQGTTQPSSSLPAPRISVKPSVAMEAVGAEPTHGAGASLSEAQRKELDATEAELRSVLANSYNDLGTAEARQQHYQSALSSFQNAEHWHEPEPALLKNIGVAAFRTEDYAEAARALGAYLQHAQDAHLRLMLAMSEFSMGHFAQAASDFGRASAQTLDDPRAAYSWAFSLARTGQQQHANEIAGQLTSLALPPDAMDLVCHVYMDTEAYQQSLACLRKVAAADPTLRLVHYGEGESLIRLDRPAEAIPELRAELNLSPGDPNVESSLAFALLQTSQKDEAKQLLEKAVATDPNHARAQYQLGKLLLDGGDAAAAVPHLELSERADASPDYVHYQLGTAYRKLGRAADAERELKSYREIKDQARAAATVPQPAAH